MNKLVLIVLAAATGAFLTACGSGGQQIHSAPQSQAEAGLIVQVDADSKDQVLAKVSEYRVLNAEHGLYEVKGIEKSALKSQFPGLMVEQNLYFENLVGEKKSNPYEGLLANGKFAQNVPTEQIPPALEGCDTGLEVFPTASLKVLSKALQLEPQMELGDEFILSAADSQPNETLEGDLEVRWDLMPPRGSKITADVVKGNELKMTPDMVGLYQLILVVKQGNACAGSQVRFAVTYNPEIEYFTADEGRPTIPLENFTHLARMSYDKAQTMATGKGKVVAVLDTGLHYNHKAIKFNLAIKESEKAGNPDQDDDENNFADDILGWDFVNGDSRPFDDEGHGSHVAGLISSHIHGMAPNSKIMPIKVLNAGGGGDSGSIIAGIYYATDNGANVINASLQRLSTQIPGLTKAIEYAHSKGVVFISASGNDGLDLSLPGVDIFPGEIDAPNVVNVGAIGSMNMLTDYSNYGRNQVDVAAPGGDDVEPIYSLATLNPDDVPYIGSGGTSMAAPIVAGVAALMLEANPNLTPEQVRDILMTSGESLQTLEMKVGSGRLLDAAIAVEKAQNQGLLVPVAGI